MLCNVLYSNAEVRAHVSGVGKRKERNNDVIVALKFIRRSASVAKRSCTAMQVLGACSCR
jgi:hypothetical protein